MPFTTNSEEVMKPRGDYWRFIPDQPSEFLVTPRKANAPNHPDWKAGEFRKYNAPHSLVIHTGNAWEEEHGVLKLESHFVSFNVFDFFNPKDYKRPQGKPSGDWIRWTLDLSKPNGTAVPSPKTLLSGIFDFPIYDKRRTGLKTKIVYLTGMIALEQSERPRFNRIIKLNTEMGEKSIFYTADYGSVAEPAYIPRGSDCDEGDGWVIFYMAKDSSAKGELVILDCKDFSKPVAIAQLPFQTRSQVHGNWVPNPHPERSLPLLTGPIKDVLPSTK
jgi:carotenoid cleavage dioxygenase